MPWEYCASRWVSVALRAAKMGYDLHGHDVEVTVCIDSSMVLDVESLARSLDEVLEAIDYKPLWRPLKVDDPLLESLLIHVHKEMTSRGYKVSLVEARLPRGRVIRLKPRDG